MPKLSLFLALWTGSFLLIIFIYVITFIFIFCISLYSPINMPIYHTDEKYLSLYINYLNHILESTMNSLILLLLPLVLTQISDQCNLSPLLQRKPWKCSKNKCQNGMLLASSTEITPKHSPSASQECQISLSNPSKMNKSKPQYTRIGSSKTFTSVRNIRKGRKCKLWYMKMTIGFWIMRTSMSPMGSNSKQLRETNT